MKVFRLYNINIEEIKIWKQKLLCFPIKASRHVRGNHDNSPFALNSVSVPTEVAARTTMAEGIGLSVNTYWPICFN